MPGVVTSYPSTCIDGNLIRRRYQKLLKELSVLIQRLHNSQLVFNYGEKVSGTKPADLVRVLSEWSQKDFIDLAIRNIIVDTILSSENKQIGSGIICALSLLSQVSISEDLRLHRKPAEISDLDASLKYFLGDGLLAKITYASLQMGSLGGNLRFELSNNKDFILESTTAVNIGGHIHPLFQCDNSRKLHLPRIICVDGIIESVGEIDNLLREAADYKSTVVICALGFHPDIVNTLSQNWKEDRLKVVPFVVSKWSLETPEDAITSCDRIGLTCVSREKGEVLASQKLENFSSVESVYLSSRTMAIQNELGDEVHLEIRVPKVMSRLAGLIEDRIRIALQSCTGIAKWGRLKNHEIFKVSKKLGIAHPEVSISAAVFGIKSAKACKKNINELGAAVIPDIK